MRKFTNSILTIIVFNTIYISIANAQINNTYQYTSSITIESATTTQLISNDSIILNPDIDEIKASDPRIKSVIEYVKRNGIGVSVVFFNPENLRYVRKVNELFKANHIFTDPPQLTKTKNLGDFNLIKIYVIEDKNHVNESNEATSSAKSNHRQ